MTSETENEVVLSQGALLERINEKITGTEIVYLESEAKYKELSDKADWTGETMTVLLEFIGCQARLSVLREMWELVAGEAYPEPE